MSKPGSISQGSLLDLKAITAEQADKFAKEGRAAVRGARSRASEVAEREKARDPFLRPSPGLVQRLAREARADAKRSVFDDDPVDDSQRRTILEDKARKYAALKRGDTSGFTEKELAEVALDFNMDGAWSDHSSDIDESAAEARDPFDTLADMEEVEYVDEMGRTRRGTRREAHEAEAQREHEEWRRRARGREAEEAGPSTSARMDPSQLIHGDQSFFPVYQPDPEVLRQKYLEAEREARQQHYDSTKEVRTRGAGAYQFALDDAMRAAQRECLDAERARTERARAVTEKRGESAARERQRRRMEERRAVVEAKRAQLIGGRERLARLREERRAREADSLFADVEAQIRRSQSPDKQG